MALYRAALPFEAAAVIFRLIELPTSSWPIRTLLPDRKNCAIDFMPLSCHVHVDVVLRSMVYGVAICGSLPQLYEPFIVIGYSSSTSCDSLCFYICEKGQEDTCEQQSKPAKPLLACVTTQIQTITYD